MIPEPVAEALRLYADTVTARNAYINAPVEADAAQRDAHGEASLRWIRAMAHLSDEHHDLFRLLSAGKTA